jgi:hypothetical protein
MQRRPISDNAKAELRPLLYKRSQSARRLNTSTATIKRLEADGVLDQVRLRPGGQVHNRAEQVDALARGERT